MKAISRVARLVSDLGVGASESTRTPSQAEILLEVSHKLHETRPIAQLSQDRELLYFIDMAILHVGQILPNRLDLDVQDDQSA